MDPSALDLQPGLGRRYAPDPLDANFPIQLTPKAALTPEQERALARGWRYWWPDGAWLYQGRTGTCVPHAGVHWLEDGPVTYDGPRINPFELYREVVQVDEWSGNDHEATGPESGMQFGSSIRALFKVLQRKGLVGTYRWGTDAETLVRTLLTEGPVVMGTIWTDAMMRWDAEGIIRYDGGRADQGHAYVANGVNTARGLIRIKAWGHKRIGKKGHLFLPIEDAARLIRDDGEVCLAEPVGTAD